MVDGWDALRAKYTADPRFRLGMVKLFVDGVIETHTAKLLAPYANRPTDGPSNYTAEELTRVVTLLDRRGWQVMMHAVGDGAVRMALDAVEAAAAANPVPERGRRHRIDHIETLDPADEATLQGAGRGGVDAPGRHLSDARSPAGGQRARHGAPRPPRRSACGPATSVRNAPPAAAAGSASATPAAASCSAATGRSPSFDPSGRLFQVAVSPPRAGRPDGRLPLMAAIDAYTSQAAWLEFEDGRKGTLAPGQLADFVILATNAFATPPAAPADLAVAATVFGGKVVYERR